MAYKQLISPNLDASTLNVYVYGKPLTTWRGWCLAVTDAAFGVPPFAATALDAWKVNTTKHLDRNTPEGCFVPIFYQGDPKGYGHVAICLREGNRYKIWTSPYTDKCSWDYFEGANAIDLLIRYGYGKQYLGWTETLGSKRIVEYYEEPKPEPTPVPEPGFKVGDKVVPTRLVDYNGTPLVQYDPYYTITQISGDRAVLSAPRGDQMVVWAAMNTKDIKKI